MVLAGGGGGRPECFAGPDGERVAGLEEREELQESARGPVHANLMIVKIEGQIVI